MKRLLHMILLVQLIGMSCNTNSTDLNGQSKTKQQNHDNSLPTINGNTMNPEVRGELPEWFKENFAGRDTKPMSSVEALKFQSIARGKSGIPNFRWVLHYDGAIYYAENSGPVEYGVVFDSDYPDLPTINLPEKRVHEILEMIRQSDFFDHPPYLGNPKAKGGSLYILTARNSPEEEPSEVVYDAHRPPVIDFLLEFTYEQLQK